MTIRKITEQDNPQVAEMIRAVLIEFAAPREGTAFADASLDAMYEEYNKAGSSYFIVEEDGKIQGGAGIAPLAGGEPNICELQKMYFRHEIRNRGIGIQMITQCLDHARSLGYKYCYLETLPGMKAAQKLYLKSGYTYLTGAMGSTGHHACTVWMIKEL